MASDVSRLKNSWSVIEGDINSAHECVFIGFYSCASVKHPRCCRDAYMEMLPGSRWHLDQCEDIMLKLISLAARLLPRNQELYTVDFLSRC